MTNYNHRSFELGGIRTCPGVEVSVIWKINEIEVVGRLHTGGLHNCTFLVGIHEEIQSL